MLNYKSRYSAKPTFPETGGGSTSIRIRVIVAGGGWASANNKTVDTGGFGKGATAKNGQVCYSGSGGGSGGEYRWCFYSSSGGGESGWTFTKSSMKTF